MFMAQYNIYQLRNYANKFLQENYNMSLEIPLTLNSRLKKTCGWFRSNVYRDGRREAKCIEMNKFFVENNEPTVVLDILRHELTHYALFALGKQFRDGEADFENELRAKGIVSQSSINKYNIESKPVSLQIYECASCHTEFKRKRALPRTGSYRCQCGGNLIDRGKRLVKP